MITEFLMHNLFMTGIIITAILSIFLQWLVTVSLKGYVKASANMKTTKKKLLIGLKNQFEAMHDMNSQVKNMDAYVDRCLLKLQFMGITYSGWEKLSYLTAGLILIISGAGAFYGYISGATDMFFAELLFATGISLVCLFVFFHIYGIKTRRLQIHIQLVDYLENYLSNRLEKNASDAEKNQKRSFDEEMENAYLEGKREALKETLETEGDETVENSPYDQTTDKEDDQKTDITDDAIDKSAEEDMEMLKRLIREMDDKRDAEKIKASDEVAVSIEEESDIELLEEFVQSFLS